MILKSSCRALGPWAASVCLALLLAAGAAEAGNRNLVTANAMFGAVSEPTQSRRTEVIGTYTRGCIQGAVELPVTGPTWEVMRLSRNRNWGHPDLVRFIRQLAGEASRDGWHGLLIGDMGQPRGGPMSSGHASHQIGLDVDIWLMPAPTRPLSVDERESIRAISMVKSGKYAIDPTRWGPSQAALVRDAASFPEVERVFVNPGIKKALCATTEGDRSWLGKVRPWYGHDEHMHVRLRCPADQPLCHPQDPPPKGDGCGADLATWLRQTPYVPKELNRPARPLSLSALPPACRAVLRAP